MISVVLATHNEEANLGRCLDSVKSWANEIIIVDGESSDETVSIAKSYKAKVIATTNKANFHINKQMGIDAAQGNLILQLDADEVVDEELQQFIKQTEKELLKRKEEDDNQPAAWWIKRKNLFLGKFLRKGGQYPDPVIRLFLKGRAYLPQKDVHEQMEVDGKLAWADGHFIHYANPTFQDYLRKFNTYTSFKAQQLADQKVSLSFSSACYYCGFLPLKTFVLMYFRHKGFVDGVPGFVFAVMSGLHHTIAYLKYWEMKAA